MNGFYEQFIVTSSALEKTEKPKRIHTKKQHDRSGKYHERIQKKWNKRFGYVMQPCIFKLNDKYFIHPSIMAELRTNFAYEHPLMVDNIRRFNYEHPHPQLTSRIFRYDCN